MIFVTSMIFFIISYQVIEIWDKKNFSTRKYITRVLYLNLDKNSHTICMVRWLLQNELQLTKRAV